MQRRILITGATGTIGTSAVRHLAAVYQPENISIACRSKSEGRAAFPELARLEFRIFDFECPASGVFDQIDTVFLFKAQKKAASYPIRRSKD